MTATPAAALLRRMVATFAARHPELASPDDARERCAEISEEFAALLTEHGIAAAVISGGRYGEVDQFPGVRLFLGGHYAVLVPAEGQTDGVVYDWTARQFDPTAPVPLVEPVGAWGETWQPFTRGGLT